ncbi:hypothetical protein F4560_001112 [Saccharothrix ecbatanensis]|uniref:Uncharacterized protein n=1 Tax=Saccharothrix ecbatanensis TaxID=1105145 RepID=A0A7W9LYY3_9PSEU|nr:hypothetical protein [Saccharothrix ecbatanensis]MBB5801344.1 hypothetical protein [Saccharothrix ecbatanensis]
MLWASLGTSVVLMLLAFVGLTGYRVALVGGTCLALASGGLLLQKAVGWMPADQVEPLSYQFGTVVAVAVVAIPFGLRRDVAGAVTAAMFAVVTFGCRLFADITAVARIGLMALTLLLVLIAVHVVGEQWMMIKAAGGAFLSVRRVWRSGMVIASVGLLGTAASGLMPEVWLALGLVFLRYAGIMAAIQLAGFAIILVRNGAFARAWVKRWSSTRRRATADLVRWIAASVGALMLLGVSAFVQPPAPVSIALLVGGVACLTAAGTMLRRILDHAAHHRYIIELPVSPRSALRGLVASEPVYRLLPGISREGP